jgi:cell division inhibitor SulA/protein ImuA
MGANPAFTALRERLDHRHREATTAALARGDDEVVRTELDALDRALGGGFPRGAIGTLEGPPSSGRSALAARLLAAATRRGLAALIGIELFPPALAAAGVRLERLLLVDAATPLDAARAADVVVRSGAFTVVVVPALPSGRGTGAATWTRLASLAHRANAALVALGDDASAELASFATVRVETAIARVRWNGAAGHCSELVGYDVHAIVRKHKRAAPTGDALLHCEQFDDRPTFVALREREIERDVLIVAVPSAANGRAARS